MNKYSQNEVQEIIDYKKGDEIRKELDSKPKKFQREYLITCLVGETGCGKTSVAQALVLTALAQGKKVWSNVPLWGAMQLDFEDLLKFEFTLEDEERCFNY